MEYRDTPECQMKGCEGGDHFCGNLTKHRHQEASALSGKFNENDSSFNMCPTPNCNGSQSTKSMHNFHRMEKIKHLEKNRTNLSDISLEYKRDELTFRSCNTAPVNNRKTKRVETLQSKSNKRLKTLDVSELDTDSKADLSVKEINEKEHMCYQFQMLKCKNHSVSIDLVTEQKNQQQTEFERLSKELDMLQDQELGLARAVANKQDYFKKLKHKKVELEETYDEYYSLLLEVAKELNLVYLQDRTQLDILVNIFESVRSDQKLYTQIQHLLQTKLRNRKKRILL